MIKSVIGRFMAGAIVATTLVAAPAKSEAATIVGVAQSVNQQSGEFSTLLAAAQAAGLVGILDGNIPLTVFAPTDAAFAKLGITAANVGTLPKKQLQQILLYHVSLGKRLSGSVLTSRFLLMANFQFARVKADASGAFINSSKLLAPDLIDIEASNGVIHVIDTVLVPPSFR